MFCFCGVVGFLHIDGKNSPRRICDSLLLLLPRFPSVLLGNSSLLLAD